MKEGRVEEMASGTRMPTWKERENNKRRERRRRAIAAKIYAGLRMYGNYKLPKHCDNNAVLKALCEEAGWAVEEDGTTYRKGCKQVEHVDIVGSSASPSPCVSYNPSPASSTLASPMSSTLITNAKNLTSGTEGNSLVPWLNSLSSASSTSTSSKLPNVHHLYIHGGSISAPVTPPLSSPTAQSSRIKTDWDAPAIHPTWSGSNLTFLPSSMPPSPGHQDTPQSAWLAGLRLPSGGPSSPTFSLISSNPLVFYKEASGSQMLTPGQSGTCSPVPGGHSHGDVQMSDGGSDEFEFGSSSNGTDTATGLVKPWEGEMIHEECASDELDLTLGSSKTKSVA
ncbi:BES1 BZR1 [Musa troglodytarum]|uniref:Protein BZR1 homolog n=1 Tax=Musa troglodytarum TaxID=320322 RepID=A0A9E7KL87_9LILI|nr:BES1 BZR1 [Musa troglodytarum]